MFEAAARRSDFLKFVKWSTKMQKKGKKSNIRKTNSWAR